MLDDQEAKNTLWVNKIKIKCEITLQDVWIKGKGRKFDEFGHAIKKSLQSSWAFWTSPSKISIFFPITILLYRIYPN